jgi:photosystem II stability/assembly factor-like uncharacterized protein
MRKSVIFYFGTAFLVTCLAGCGAMPSSSVGREWKVVLQSERVNTAMIAGFLDENHGIAAGVGGETHYTLDGGKTWPDAENASACRYGLDIVDAKIVWSTGNQGGVRLSTDGGKTWQAVTDLEVSRSFLISFVDGNTGWAGSVSNLFTTSDGGQTWQEVIPPDGVGEIAAVSLRTATEGYVLDSNGLLYVTQDGGKSWTAKPLGLEKKIFSSDTLPMAAIRFTDANSGIVIVSPEDSDGALVALRTTDGGSSWNQEALPAKSGPLHITHDGRFVSILGGDSSITLLHYD